MVKKKKLVQKEEVQIRRRDGALFSLTSKNNNPASLFNVPGIKTKATTKDILEAIRSSRMR